MRHTIFILKTRSHCGNLMLHKLVKCWIKENPSQTFLTVPSFGIFAIEKNVRFSSVEYNKNMVEKNFTVAFFPGTRVTWKCVLSYLNFRSCLYTWVYVPMFIYLWMLNRLISMCIHFFLLILERIHSSNLESIFELLIFRYK